MLGVSAMAAQRGVELVHARRNEAAARSRGAIEVGAGHYPVIVGMHAAWLGAVVLEGRRSTRIRFVPLATLAAAQVLRYWAIRSLGPQWTTRIIVDPTALPVTDGPYHYLAHPNYVAVAVEMAALPLVFGARRTAVAFSLVDALVLRHRIRVEDHARRCEEADGDVDLEGRDEVGAAFDDPEQTVLLGGGMDDPDGSDGWR